MAHAHSAHLRRHKQDWQNKVGQGLIPSRSWCAVHKGKEPCGAAAGLAGCNGCGASQGGEPI